MMFNDKQGIKGHIIIYYKLKTDTNWIKVVDEYNMIVNPGLDLIKEFILNGTAAYPQYCAIGSGTTAITSADTYLEEEVWRNVFQSVDDSVARKITYETYFSSVQANGNDYISNVALFTSAPVLIEDGESVADWSAGGTATITASNTIYQNGSNSMKFACTSGAATGTKTTSIGNISSITGVDTGTPTKGRARILLQTSSIANLNGTNAIQYEIGSDSSNKVTYNFQSTDFTTTNDWEIWDIDLTSGTVTGTPDWTAIDYNKLTVNATGVVNVYFDDIQVFGPTMFNAQTFTEFYKDKNTELLVYYTLEFMNI